MDMQHIELYRQNGNKLEMDEFVDQYLPLVRKIACYLRRRLPSHVDFNDMMQSGMVGLLEAKKTFRFDMNSSFETYAGIRIKGCIIDGLRKNSWNSRDASAQLRKISKAINEIEQRTCGQASSEEIANVLGLTSEDYQDLVQKISFNQVATGCEVEEFSAEEVMTPHGEAEKLLLIKNLEDVLLILPEKEQKVLSLYYVDDFTLSQIGEILNLTEARICQLHSQAIARIRSKMNPDGTL